MGHGEAAAELCRGLIVADYAGLAAWCLLHVAIGAAGTWLARRYALRRNLVDQPGERRSHHVATPRGGGISIVVSALLAFGWLAWTYAVAMPVVAAIAAGLVLIAGIGWLDDHRPLSPWLRLAIQAVAAAFVGIALLAGGRDAGMATFGFMTTMVFVNVWNFMDGIDGLAASQAVLIAAGWAWLAWPAPWAWLLLAVAAACLGFLPFNLPRARIFLGDVGSGALGYLLAIGLLWLPVDTTGLPWLAWLPLSAFLVDATLTLCMRILKGERWWTPHLQHVYQRWAARCGMHGQVTIAFALWTACATMAMVLLRGSDAGTRVVATGTIYIVAVAAWVWLRRGQGTLEGAQ
jgi:UDP-N-acetylmuramyl pentapeptide phosphotransferase/UDP-N-acetylglucosamine-1-phosphate transferase